MIFLYLNYEFFLKENVFLLNLSNLFRMNTILKSAISKTVRNLSTPQTVNQVILIGFVIKDPKISFKNSKTSFDVYKSGFIPLRTNRNVEDSKNENIKFENDYHGVFIYNQELNEYIESSKISKGDQLYVNGEIQSYKGLNNNGKAFNNHCIVAKDILMISERERNNGLKTVNQVTLIGFVCNISADQSKYRSNNCGSTISLATKRYDGRDKDGISKYKTNWHRVVIRDGDLNDFIQKPRLSKGDKIYVNGEINYSQTSNDRNEPKRLFIVANEISIISKKQQAGDLIKDVEDDNFENNQKLKIN